MVSPLSGKWRAASDKMGRVSASSWASRNSPDHHTGHSPLATSPQRSEVRGVSRVRGGRKARNLPAFPAHWDDLPPPHGRDPEEISSEAHPAPPPRRRQAENPTPARPAGR